MKCHPHRTAATYVSLSSLDVVTLPQNAHCSIVILLAGDVVLRHTRTICCLPWMQHYVIRGNRYVCVPFVLYYRHIEWNNNASTVNHRHICGICMYVYMLKFCHIIAALWLCWNLGRQKIHCDIVSNIEHGIRGGEGKGKNRDTSFWNDLKIFDVLDNNLLFVYLAIIFPDKTSRQRGRGYKFK